MESGYVTIQEAAELLGTTREKVGRMVKRGELPSRPSKIDARRKLIARDVIDRLLAEEGHKPPRKLGPKKDRGEG